MINQEKFVPVLLEKVYSLIQDKVKGDQQFLIHVFAERLLGQLADEDLLQRNESDLYGSILSLWQHVEKSKTDNISVLVYNPSLRSHGWKSTHTVVEIVMPDMPFVVDSVRMTLRRLGISSHLMLNGPYRFERGGKREIIKACGEKGDILTLFHIEVDRQTKAEQMALLKSELEQVLFDIKLIVKDWQPMQIKMTEIANDLKNQTLMVDNNQRDEATEFLNWLACNNFTFMGYRKYDLEAVSGDFKLSASQEQGLGLLSKPSKNKSLMLSSLPESARIEARKPEILILTKANRRSLIHRSTYIDYIGIKRFDKNGVVIGEHRFLGLYALSAYNSAASEIPLIRNRIARILESSDYERGSHSWKALNNLLETYPRDELIQARENELLEMGAGVIRMQGRDLLRLSVRRDPFGRFFSCMVYVTKERFNTELRTKTQGILQQYFGSDQKVEFTSFSSELPLARIHCIVRVKDNNFDIDVKNLEHNLTIAAASWDDRLMYSLLSNYGESRGTPIAKNYANAFPRSYTEEILPGSAVADISQLENLSDESKLGMLFYRSQEESTDSRYVKLKLYHRNEQVYLSDVMPMLENLGLRVIDESPHQVVTTSGIVYWILDFLMLHNAKEGIDLTEARDRFQDSFSAIWHGRLESDGFNRLILAACLTGREVTILRAYARYMRQVGFPFSQKYIEDTLSNHHDVASDLVTLFKLRFDPNEKYSEAAEKIQITKLNDKLDLVESLDDDRIIRRFMEMIIATQRTNYFQMDNEGNFKTSLSLKLRPTDIPDIPPPVPFFEIFVYSPHFEGVHLRGGKVARGGLRWSDRQEDFRTEILGLVKAQQVKNSVIVPVGAKGGFICRRQPQMTNRQEIFSEGKKCYESFIRAMLDLTDNIIDGVLTPPDNVVRHDGDDPYLVVAADKGTATFSDLANSVSADYKFWLGDAFASGGSYGYDHKKMGITAKGGWESVKRHFRELGVDCQTTDFTCVGIGDMGGDVFGNGMLLSKHTCLVAAFNHIHIFLDPNPDAEKSWNERYRLFNASDSSWQNYNPKLISSGGGVFFRKSKSIKLTSEIQKLLGTRKKECSPTDLIKMILQLNVDLIWNGGIGTYIKAELETNSDVGDRANDALRINGKQLRSKIVGEGGNLGVTQLGRIEFAQNGGKINTDFIDNVGGVDCSDNEVNIKILLNGLVSNGELTSKHRNQLLEQMEDEVGQIVLKDAYLQSESISVGLQQQVRLLKEQLRFIHYLEREGKLDRTLENLPDDDTLFERQKVGKGLTRPEFAVLLAYGKMLLKENLVVDEIVNEPYHARLLPCYFPQQLQQYQSEMKRHPLRRELIATTLANQMTNDMGSNFVIRIQEETGASVAEITSAYSIGREIFNFSWVFDEVRALDNNTETRVQYDMFYKSRQILRRVTRWLLRNNDRELDIPQQISFYKTFIADIRGNLDKYLVPEERKEQAQQEKEMMGMGVPKELAQNIAQFNSLFSAMDIAQITKEVNQDPEYIASIYYILGSRLSLHWFLKQIQNQPEENHWQSLARTTFREDLDWQHRQLVTSVILTKQEDAETAINDWFERHQEAIDRWESVLAEFKIGKAHEFAKFSVALRELMLLNIKCRPSEPPEQ